jgi:hypothetical protein
MPPAHSPPRPAITSRSTLPRPPHPPPYVRDDRETPLYVGRDGEFVEMICPTTGKAEYFSNQARTRDLLTRRLICPTRQPVGWMERSDTHHVREFWRMATGRAAR